MKSVLHAAFLLLYGNLYKSCQHDEGNDRCKTINGLSLDVHVHHHVIIWVKWEYIFIFTIENLMLTSHDI